LGVVTPYTTQVETTTNLLDETEAGAAIDVGTSHRFQGREFDVVVFDTLETGGKPGWVAQGGAGPKAGWALDGLRLFTVGVTRSSRRLYILANAAALTKAPGGPLSHLRDMIDRGEVEVIQASRALGIDEPDPAVSSPARDDIQAALKPYVRVVDIHDQEQVLEAVRARIDGARSRLWVWSPWIGRHTAALQDALVAAQKRGVDVRLVALPDEELRLPNRQALDALRGRLQHVVTVARVHQKIVVVDDRWSFVGSMNLLSYGPTPSRRRHDLMVEIESRSFAADLLDHEWAHELAKPPACPRCRIEIRDVRHYAGGRSGGTRGWHWVCRTERDGQLCRQRVAFAKNPSLVDWEPIPRE
jgi:hypothetical protein